MPGYRHRYMYYATGLPGWMRFGFSPGWLGTSPTGLGPGATFLMTGRWPTPQAQSFWQTMQPGAAPFYPPMESGLPPQGQNAQPTKEQEVEFLRTQADKLRGELERIKERLAQLE